MIAAFSIVSILGQLFASSVGIWNIVIKWIAISKANEPGWSQIIPFYGDYIRCKVAGKKKLFIFIAVLYVLTAFATVGLVAAIAIAMFTGLDTGYYSSAGLQSNAGAVIGAFTGSLTLLVIAALIIFLLTVSVIMFIINAVVCVSIARKFGFSGGFGIGMVFLPYIFWAIIAFGNCEYNQGIR